MKNLLHVFLVISLLLFAGEIYAQQKTVSGRVTDSLNEGIPGVNVQVKGTKTGAITDLNGRFSISVPGSKSVLVFTFVGCSPQEVIVGNQTKLNVQLQEDAQALDEIVVIGYGTSRKGDITGALTNLRPDAKDASKAVSIDGLLQGKIAGLNVNTSMMTPGAASSVTIRGANSLRGDNQPLYVIDNVPQSSTGEFGSSPLGGSDYQIAQDPLSSINPSDIEDITVLKDASATAIYGSRGANGVILITTKKGLEGKAKVNISVNFDIANAVNLHEMMDLEQYGQYRNLQLGTATQFFFVDDEVRYVFSGNTEKYDANDPDSYRVLTYRNWQKEIYEQAMSQNYTISVSGGSKAIKYYLSGAFKNIKGTVPTTGIKQGDLRANITAELSKAVTITMALSGSIKQNTMMAGGGTTGGATGSISRTAIDTAPYVIPPDDPSLGTSPEARNNVFSWINDYDDMAVDKTFKASADLLWKINKFFSYNLRVGGNLNTNDRNRWYAGTLPQAEKERGMLTNSSLNKSSFTVENLLNYNTKLGKIGTLGATVGITYDDATFLNKNIKGTMFDNYDLRTHGMHVASLIVHQQPEQNDYQLLSYLGRVNLSFLDKYILTGSLRADGTSKFKQGNRWSYFPSFSLAWRLEQEKFLKEFKWLDQLKIRGGYGVTGSQNIASYTTLSDYSHVMDYAAANGDKTLAMAVSKLQNDGLVWERTSSWNVGVDFSVFKQRLSGTVDVYKKKTTNLLISRNLPLSSGFESVMLNQGSLLNKGVEITLDADVIRSKSWTWSLGGNIGFNAPTIEDLGFPLADFGNLRDKRGYLGPPIGDHFGSGHIFIAGESPGRFFGYKTNGIVQSSEVEEYRKEITKDINGGLPSAGDIKFVDLNGDHEITDADKTIIGNPTPDFIYGFNTSLSWKDLSFSMTFTGKYGNEILGNNIRYEQTPSKSTSNLHRRVFENMWTPEKESKLYPSATYALPTAVVMDRYVEDGSYLRCSDITLSYMLPKHWMKQIGFRNINVFASVKNAFIITNYSGYDPEVNTFAFAGGRPGVDMNAFPSMRSFIFGLSLNF